MVTLVLTPETKDAGNVKFTIDRHVGKGKLGAAREDILLVQFCLQLLRTSNASYALKIPPQTLNGDGDDPAMIAGIIAFQKQSPAMAQDGYCSPFAHHAYGKPGVFTLSLMEGSIIARNTQANGVWPRLDLLKTCPGDLADAIKREIGILQIQAV